MNEFNNKYLFIRDNYTGEGGYSPYNSYSYLIQFPRETDEFYKDRKSNSVLENIFQPLQDLFLEPILAKQADFKTQNKILEEIVKQTKLFSHSAKSLLDFKLYGKCIFSVYTDILEDGTADINTLPDIESVFPADIERLNMNGIAIKDAIYKEYKAIDDVKIPVLVEYSDNYFSKTTKAWRDENGEITIVDQGEESRLTDFDGYKYGVLSKIGLELDDIPKTFNLAQIQKLLFNLDTQRLDTLRKNGFPIMMIQTGEELDGMSLSNDTIIRIPADDAIKHMPDFLEADLEGVTLTTNIIEEKKSTVYKVFTNGLFSDNIKYASTMSSIIATKSFKNTVDTLYLVKKDIDETMLNSILFIYEISTNSNIDYPEIDLADEDMKTQTEEILSL